MLAWPAQTLHAIWSAWVGLAGWPAFPEGVLDVVSFAQHCYEAVLAVPETPEGTIVICRRQQNSLDRMSYPCLLVLIDLLGNSPRVPCNLYYLKLPTL
ncbi:hypothetical protein H4582DRAFT_1978123 [Lactarius indigo]|nr:hypothetical protein H4582DRAFT_1978123 [Lactarius indigo]